MHLPPNGQVAALLHFIFDKGEGRGVVNIGFCCHDPLKKCVMKVFKVDTSLNFSKTFCEFQSAQSLILGHG